MEQSTFMLLGGVGLLFGLVAVVIDRLNFPQPRFRAKGIRVNPSAPRRRDRTGAHIVDHERLEPVRVGRDEIEQVEASDSDDWFSQ